ncbi:MAG: hypothetical protein A3G32_02535 [Deltaproteobacteria bacterium RIFCSPLOWO2_12_FULL_40_28]|nr:MAG: hypothetical protein A3C45_03215 [Deltaproteobacteria bacterium RIFCSPHIGHO2_02_FULL_40_28]OGQ20701.1 MAG: hypothetical protein A3E27_10325 [Deltaproteobacteria bacterium RIFCSPHIGHO2_12_FULL_40_32]OGQ38936.1 MAG: hypothetical protein A3I69_08545 [Deltaproteobacteria bacterium RIFCSPLOWO2_02_FULL_40_36]OGQ55296.1 MAG: hypothetical protein A3G32_02535 [Deltaproteobacteria bacterium RIFCSPLOWO2_12_FULL_40_28]
MRSFTLFGTLTLCVLYFVSCADGQKAVKSSDDYEPTYVAEADPRIQINVAARELTLFEGDRVVYRFPVAVGAASFKTPTGKRQLDQIVWNPWWMPPKSEWAKNEKPTPPGPGNPLGPVKMRLGEAILVHGTSRETSVGTPASHGCMRMFNRDAKTLAWWIQSKHTDQNDPALLVQYQQNTTSSYYVEIPNPIPVDIIYDLFEVKDGMFRAHPDIYGHRRDRKGEAVAEIESFGINSEKIDVATLTRVLDLSQVKSVEIPIDDLAPAKLVERKHKVKDPIEVSWEVKQQIKKGKYQASLNRLNQNKGKFSFLF